jgi:hypothetical protein
LIRLAGDIEESVRRRVAENPAAPKEALALLAVDPHHAVRGAAARRPETPPALVALLRRGGATPGLSAQEEPLPALSPEDAAALAECGHFGRLLLAQNPTAPTALLEALAAQEGDLQTGEIRALVAQNPATPLGLRLAMAGGRHLFRSGDRAVDWTTRVRVALASAPEAPAAVLEALERDPDEAVRKQLAKAPSAPSDLLARLAADPIRDVRWCVLKHPRTPRTALEALAADTDPYVRAAAKERLGG